MSRYQNRPRFPHHSSLNIKAGTDHEREQIEFEMERLVAHLKAADAARMPLVYAVLRAEAPVIKIGFTRTLGSRIGSRLSRMPGARLVAVIPGGRREEMAIHQRLASSRVTMDLPGDGGSEHFHLTEEVIDWINEARSAIGLDLLTRDYLVAS